MIDARRLTDGFTAAPQIDPGDLPALKALGYALLINNRPDAEVPPTHQSEAFAAAAAAIGLDYRVIPVAGGFSSEQIAAMAEAVAQTPGPVFAWCRSGTRSTCLWALAQAMAGADPQALLSAASRGGYDLAMIAPALDDLHSR